MKFSQLVPNVFYTDIKDGLELFVDCLEFTVGYDELNSANPFCVVEKGNLRANLFQNKEYAEKDRPEFRLVTDNIEEVFAKVSSTHPHLLHPSLPKPTKRPWTATEFALIGASGVCMIIQQWPE